MMHGTTNIKFIYCVFKYLPISFLDIMWSKQLVQDDYIMTFKNILE